MGIIIQKFGGTSVGTGERLLGVAEIIRDTRRRNPVIAVVSAMSSKIKSQGTTSLLLEAAHLAVRGRSFDQPLKTISDHHRASLGEAVKKAASRKEVEAWLKGELATLEGFLEAIQVIRELSPRSQDLLLAYGERFCARLLAATLIDQGVPAGFVDLTHVLPDRDKPVDPAFFRRVQKNLARQCAPEKKEVPVVTGFFGMVPGGLLRAVGRGYTDFTAALIAAGLGHKEVDEMQVWKEVDGIFTADPRRVAQARVLPRITPTEASELTYFGSEVLHPFTMERVVSAQIPIRIKNTFNPSGPGTVIAKREGRARPGMRATAVTAKRGITIVTVTSNRMYNAYGFLAGVFNTLADHDVVVDLVSTSEVSISFTVDRPGDIEMAVPRLKALGSVDITPGRAILALVGEGMKYAKGTSGSMFTSLGAAGINIEMISQGASEINISCVITEESVEMGLNAVHRSFLESGEG